MIEVYIIIKCRYITYYNIVYKHTRIVFLKLNFDRIHTNYNRKKNNINF